MFDMKKNNSDEYESIFVSLSPDKTPIAYKNKVDCLMLPGSSREEAEKLALEPIELEIYYETGCGLFGVEPEAIESGGVTSPYNKELIE